jgi:hypothetical protein
MPDAASALSPSALLAECLKPPHPPAAAGCRSAELIQQAEPPAGRGRFQPGHPKTGGRRPGVPNKAKTYTVARILELSDPIAILARIANGQPFELAPQPGAEPVTVYPTMADVLQAAIALARKVAPDLKAVRVEEGGVQVSVLLQLTSQSEPPPPP